MQVKLLSTALLTIGLLVFFVDIIYLLWSACVRVPVSTTTASFPSPDSIHTDTPVAPATLQIPIRREIIVADYFSFVDSLVTAYDTLVDYALTEHVLVRANPWIIDTLVHTDYYRQAARGRFVYDQRKLTVLQPGDTLRIPTPEDAFTIQQLLHQTTLDVNMPEFKLRIYVADSVRHTFPVRVGQNRQKYLATAGRMVDLRTPVGTGSIVRIERNPYFVDPASGEAFSTTKRDDGRRTRMPQVPWLEPEINGLRYGTLIHPTTNPSTLGKAYSNGCVGTPEGAAWIIYYHAPVGTRVRFRYELEIKDEQGAPRRLRDIYQRSSSSRAGSHFVTASHKAARARGRHAVYCR